MNGDVFLVDDNPANLALLAGILRAQCYKVRVANSGRSALEVVRGRPPELILLDITMPEMDGYEVCRALKADPATRAIPVIFISALDDPLDKVKAFQTGGVDYIPKPFQADEVLARVKSHVENGRLQQELRARNADLERMNAEKNEFLGIAAHDMKSPLGIIQGYAEMLLEEPEMAASERDATLQRIAASAGMMAQLIHNLLDVNAIERGMVTIRRLPVDVAQTAALVVRSYQEPARAKGQTLRFSRSDGDVIGMADPQLLPQLIANLVSNALKFSPHGKCVTVRVLPVPDAVRLEVMDEGPGLTEEDKGKLFGEFARLSARPTGGENSTGLGLSIVKHMVEAMKGRVGCVSTSGAGATFFLEFAPDELASTDKLTGAWNRRYLEDAAKEEMRCARREKSPISTMILDIDRFEKVNETHGHGAGDRILVELCRAVRGELRGTDIFARMGSDEFIVLFPRTSLATSVTLAGRLRKVVANQADMDGLRVSISAGVAEWLPGETFEDWIARAGRALYAAKRTGRDRILWAPDVPHPENADVPAPWAQFRWDESFECGEPTVDAEHRELLLRANALIAAVATQAEQPAVDAHLDALLEHLVVHFASEERILGRHGHPELEQHRALHQHLIEKALTLVGEIRAGTGRPDRILWFLAYDVVAWHLITADRECFTGLGPG